ncbi:hypothetical protein [Alphabaculovirus myunipunctae]|uniref:Uncharacterized protein n=1 Tax=Mythimna unipuncta nucleopolyhedrovirus TaxID=447897 RepID=A0A2K9VSB3_9ABAC|nr:hypothetical protein [Mythimna unipuncta nucleopolyhedrovirus]AUV65347.1 hypothetical protein [Mythimna unipuncta nucleopolyhedrovirus]
MTIPVMSTAALRFKRTYNYHNVDDKFVTFSLPSRIYRRNFGGDDDVDKGINFFIVCRDHDKDFDGNDKYKLCERQQFRFRQFRPIYSAQDSDNHLRIVPYVHTNIGGARIDFLNFATNFLDCFADINNEFRYTDRRTYNTLRTLKIYRFVTASTTTTTTTNHHAQNWIV